MPHIASQILNERPPRGIRASKQTVATMKSSLRFERPTTSLQHQKGPLYNGMPSLSLLVTNPSSPEWDFGSIRHIHKASEGLTPVSAVESVFELPSAGSCKHTPNSSTHSLFIAELEDTSPHPLKPQHTNPTLTSKSPTTSVKSSTSLSYLSHISGSTSTMSASSHVQQPLTPAPTVRSSKSQTYLHPKSPAAINSSELHFDEPDRLTPSLRPTPAHNHLRSNSAISIIDISSNEQPLPPLPIEPSEQTLPRTSPHLHLPPTVKSHATTVAETMSAIEEDHRKLLERAVAAEKRARVLQEMNLSLQRRVGYCDQNHRPKTAPTRSHRAASESTPISTFNDTPSRHRPAPLNLTQEMRFISRDYDLAARGSPTRAARRPHAPVLENTEALGISGPIPGSVIRQQITYKGTPISNTPPVATISLAEARRREKPLPYIMPLSPSAVPGFVEIGVRAEVCPEELGDQRKKKTFGDWFRWGKWQGCVKV